MQIHHTELSRQPSRQLMIGRYKIDYLIAAGTFGKVYLATLPTPSSPQSPSSCPPSTPFAIKQLLYPSKPAHRLQLQNQISILANMHHDNIVRLYEVIRERGCVYLVLEYCESDMKQYMAMRERDGDWIQEAQAMGILGQIVKGMGELVAQKIVHRDLKPANILYSGGVFKIADFGLAKYTQDQYQMLKTRVGTPFYMAPQILKNEKYTSKCDIWSLGIIFYQLIFGRLPWFACNEQSLIYNIYSLPLTFPKRISQKTRRLLEGMIAIQQFQRFSWEELLKQLNSPDVPLSMQIEKNFHRSVIQKLLTVQVNRISASSFGKKFQLLKYEEKKSIANLVSKLFNNQNREICNYFLKAKVKA